MVPVQEGLLCSWFHPNLELKTRQFLVYHKWRNAPHINKSQLPLWYTKRSYNCIFFLKVGKCQFWGKWKNKGSYALTDRTLCAAFYTKKTFHGFFCWTQLFGGFAFSLISTANHGNVIFSSCFHLKKFPKARSSCRRAWSTWLVGVHRSTFTSNQFKPLFFVKILFWFEIWFEN